MGREARVRKEREVRGEFGEDPQDLPLLYTTAQEMKEEADLIMRAKRAGIILPGRLILS